MPRRCNSKSSLASTPPTVELGEVSIIAALLSFFLFLSFFLTRLLNSGSRKLLVDEIVVVSSFSSVIAPSVSAREIVDVDAVLGNEAVALLADAGATNVTAAAGTTISSGSFLVRKDALVIIDFHWVLAPAVLALLTSCEVLATPVVLTSNCRLVNLIDT